LRQHRLKTPPGPAWARIVSAELLDEFFVPANYSVTTFYVSLGWVSVSALTGSFETKRTGCVSCWTCRTSLPPTDLGSASVVGDLLDVHARASARTESGR